MMPTLTKSKFLDGLQCQRYFWREFNDKDNVPQPNAATKAKFKEGDKIGELATTLFPGGIDVPTDDFKDNIEQTKELLKQKKPLFEPGFMFNNCFSRPDILLPVGDQWDIIEVKMGTKVKETNIHDVAFQKYCYEGNGLAIRNCYLMHINNQYVREGDLDVEQLFVKEDITEDVNALMDGMQGKIDMLFKLMTLNTCPSLLKTTIKNPTHKCADNNCLNDLPKDNVFTLYNGTSKGYSLLHDGITTLQEIPDDFTLTDKQAIQRDCARTGKPHVESEKITAFLETLQYPLYYLDFETFQTGIPPFDKVKPYAQIPFQWSLHVVQEKGGEPEHFEFLYDGHGDPREEFLASLQDVLGDSGSVIVYNQSFENTRLKELGLLYPEHQDWVESILERVIDLRDPFRLFWYYHPLQYGSASIKKVLPVLGISVYHNLAIRDGLSAASSFYAMAYGGGEDCRMSLLQYCMFDTLAEVLIVEGLEKLET